MPFAANTNALIGKTLFIHPQEGFGWMRVDGPEQVTDLEPAIGRLSFIVQKIVPYGTDCGALIGKCEISLSGMALGYAGVIARSDSVVDLHKNSVGCNLLLSTILPLIDDQLTIADPRYIYVNNTPFVRGFGVLSKGAALLPRLVEVPPAS